RAVLVSTTPGVQDADLGHRAVDDDLHRSGTGDGRTRRGAGRRIRCGGTGTRSSGARSRGFEDGVARIRVVPVDPTVATGALVVVLVRDRAAVGIVRDGVVGVIGDGSTVVVIRDRSTVRVVQNVVQDASPVAVIGDGDVLGVIRRTRVGVTPIGATRIGVTAVRRSGFGGDLTR